jgi:hypothetical protein
MTSLSARKHAGPGSATNLPPVPEPTFAERARTLVYLGRMGSLSTLSRKQPGFPFGSVMPYGLDDHGRPIFLISTMAMHTQNLQAAPHASLLVTEHDTEGEPLGASRVTLLGNVLPVPEPELAEARTAQRKHEGTAKVERDQQGIHNDLFVDDQISLWRQPRLRGYHHCLNSGFRSWMDHWREARIVIGKKVGDGARFFRRSIGLIAVSQ